MDQHYWSTNKQTLLILKSSKICIINIGLHCNGNKIGIGWQSNFSISTKHGNVKTHYDESTWEVSSVIYICADAEATGWETTPCTNLPIIHDWPWLVLHVSSAFIFKEFNSFLQVNQSKSRYCCGRFLSYELSFRYLSVWTRLKLSCFKSKTW